VFSRTWLAVLAGSVALWGMNQLGGAPVPPDPGAGSAPPVRAPGPPAAAAAVPRLAACLDEAASLDVAAVPDPVVRDVPFVERRYRARCRPVLDGEVFDAFAVAYGERSRAAVAAILEREERLAAELVAGPQAAALDPDAVWAAALGRAASDARAFGVELAAWFDARAPAAGAGWPVAAAGEGAVVDSAGAPAR